jgi:hypothetical protein
MISSYSITSSACANSQGWHDEAEVLSDFQVDDQPELCRLLDRQLAGLGTFEDLVDVPRRAAEIVGDVRAMRKEPSRFGEVTNFVDGKQPAFRREGDNPRPAFQN